ARDTKSSAARRSKRHSGRRSPANGGRSGSSRTANAGKAQRSGRLPEPTWVRSDVGAIRRWLRAAYLQLPLPYDCRKQVATVRHGYAVGRIASGRGTETTEPRGYRR